MIKWNEVTWYSKLMAVILFLGVVPALSFYIGMQYEQAQESIDFSAHQILSPVVSTSTVQANNTLTNTYMAPNGGFSINYPAGYTVDSQYTYEGAGAEKDITGVKFTIPATMTIGTNLEPDTYISFEASQYEDPHCDPSFYLAGSPKNLSVLDRSTGGGYLVASTTRVIGDSHYEETVYEYNNGLACFPIRYFIHYKNIQNSSLNTVKEFNREELLSQFELISKSFTLHGQI